MHLLYTALQTALLAQLAAGQSAGYRYTLHDKNQGTSFFNAYSFFTSPDPTNGYVQYVDRYTAASNNLTATSLSNSYMGVDYTTNLSSSTTGRQSVRIQSNQTYTYGLIIGDIAHMPVGCGVWPAFWSYGNNWPNNGEIDMIEGVNSASTNLMSLHTGPNCTVAGSGQTGILLENDCYQYSSTQSGSGCGTSYNNTQSYGAGFNSNGGGVYATEWTPSWIRVYFFPRAAIPADIQNGAPTPSSWGTPVANFQGSCDIATHFANHTIVFDTTFCGDYAGSVWSQDPVCSKLAPTCQSYVQNNPSAFKGTYWLVNYVAVYTQSALPTSTVSSTTTSSSTSKATSISTSKTTSISTSISSSKPTSTTTAKTTSTTTAKTTSTTTGKTTSTTTAKTTSTTQKTSSTLSSVKPNSTLAKAVGNSNAAPGATGTTARGVSAAKSATTTKRITQSIAVPGFTAKSTHRSRRHP